MTDSETKDHIEGEAATTIRTPLATQKTSKKQKPIRCRGGFTSNTHNHHRGLQKLKNERDVVKEKCQGNLSTRSRGQGSGKGIPRNINANHKGEQWVWGSIKNNKQVPLSDIPFLKGKV